MTNLLLGDCLEQMKQIPNGSVDMICCDPPYGTVQCRWDVVIPFEPMWEQVRRVLKRNGAAVFTASQPFTSALVMSNVKMFKCCWYWEKSRPTGHLNAKRMPMKSVEDIVVFYDKQCCYNPQMEKGKPNHVKDGAVRETKATNNCYGAFSNSIQYVSDMKFPKQVLRFSQQDPNKIVHPTQKPVALMEYLIRTYTNPGETVLDFTCGSGTTGVACVNTDRSFIGIERDESYFTIAQSRIQSAIEAKQATQATPEPEAQLDFFSQQK
jgi:DNA modification methylase